MARTTARGARWGHPEISRAAEGATTFRSRDLMWVSSLEPERIDGIQSRGLLSRIQAEHHAHQAAERNRYDHHVGSDQDGPAELLRQLARPEDAQRDTNDAPGDRQRERLDQELGQDVGRRRA